MSFIHQVKQYGSKTAQFLRENKTLFFPNFVASYFCLFEYNRLVSITFESPYFALYFKAQLTASLVCM